MAVTFEEDGIIISDYDRHIKILPDEKVKDSTRVFDIDGVEIHVDDQIWDLQGNGPYKVTRLTKNFVYFARSSFLEQSKVYHKVVTHKRPDSWERLEEDARQLDIDLNDTTDDYPRMSCCRDLVRRAKRLADKEER